MDGSQGLRSLSMIVVVACLWHHREAVAQGTWDEWSRCTRTCGGGISQQRRLCANGTKCEEPSVRYRMCNTQSCPEGSLDFRSLQCAQYNNKRYKGKLFKWVPVTSGPSKCELNCMPKGYRFYVRFAEQVVDGTSCSELGLDVCVNGKCEPVGCDKVLNSNAKFDKCRVCRGRNTACRRVSGTFQKRAGYDYMDITTVPVGATSVKVTERGKVGNYIAIREGQRYLLNGDWTVSSRGMMKIHSGHATYIRDREKHELFIHGPTTKPLTIEALVINAPIVIDYEYYVPNNARSVEQQTEYKTRAGAWSQCSKSCAGGVRRRSVYCESSLSGRRVSRSLCQPSSEIEEEACNTQPCEPEWYTTDWSPCSSSCGEGKRVRRVHCVRRVVGRDVEMLPDGSCRVQKPASMEKCTSTKECAGWVAGKWSECSRSCDGGIQTRPVRCEIRGREVDVNSIDAQSCRTNARPSERQVCNQRSCQIDWMTGNWSECSTNCGKGVQSRAVSCRNREGILFPSESCIAERKPSETKECLSRGPCKPMWHATQWSKCTTKCSNGYQIRTVFCAEKVGSSLRIIGSGNCKPEYQMPKVRRCKLQRPCFAQYFASPWRKCSASCGSGIRIREVRCYADTEIDRTEKACKNLIKPRVAELCNQSPCLGTDGQTLTGNPSGRDQLPTITSLDGPRYIRYGQPASFRCTLYGIPVPTVYWTLNNKRFDYSSSKYILQDANRLFTIANFAKEDEGILTCHGSNKIGVKSFSKRIQEGDDASERTPPSPTTTTRRESTPIISSVEGPRQVQVGESADFRCHVEGYPEPTVYWTLNNYPLREQNPRFRLLENGRSLVITKVIQEDDGLLTCYARNSQGTVAKNERIEVSAKPSATISPVRQTVSEGEALTISCSAYGRPAPTIQWRKDGVPFNGDRDGRIRMSANSISFRSTALSDTGSYECIAGNSHGVSSAVMALTVKEKKRRGDCVDRSNNTNCALIKTIGFCSHSYYSKVCCATCSSE